MIGFRYAVGISTNDEIDNFGISKALEIAGHRAIKNLQSQGIFPIFIYLTGNLTIDT